MWIKFTEITKFHYTNYFSASPILNFEAKNTEQYNSWYSQAHQTHLQAGDKTSCFQEWEPEIIPAVYFTLASRVPCPCSALCSLCTSTRSLIWLGTTSYFLSNQSSPSLNLLWSSQVIVHQYSSSQWLLNAYYVPSMVLCQEYRGESDSTLTSWSFLSASLSLSWSHLWFLCFFLKCTELGFLVRETPP